MSDRRYLIFEIRGEKYALVLEDVEEIMDPPVIYPMPKAPYYYRGVMNCHGRPMPVLDLGSLYKGDASCGTGKILVLDRKAANLAFLVDRVIHIVSGHLVINPAPCCDCGIEKSLMVADDPAKLIVPEKLVETLEQEMNRP